jgi:hypothetical protein
MSASRDHQCVVPGCEQMGRNRIGVRCRIAHSDTPPIPEKKRTDALFSVEADAYLCDDHALAGVAMTLTIAPNRAEEASLAVVCGRAISDIHSTPIKQPLEQAA